MEKNSVSICKHHVLLSWKLFRHEVLPGHCTKTISILLFHSIDRVSSGIKEDSSLTFQ